MSTPDTKTVATRLVELCNAGEHAKAIEELYADDAAHVEAMEMPGQPKTTAGKPALLAANDMFFQMWDVHGGGTEAPLVHDDRFICKMWMDVTGKQGPMAGQRMKMEEFAHYTVADGKITRAEFFYDADG